MVRDALVVGINNYQDDNLRNLNAPAEDAEAVSCLLEQYGEFNVWRLPEVVDPDTEKVFIAKTQELTLTRLKKVLVNLFKPKIRQVPDTALFYYSGYGIRLDLGIQEGFLATSDVAPGRDFNGLSLQWLRRLLQESPVRQQIIWLDCCHSGEILNFNEVDPGEQGQAKDRCFIAASRGFEQSYENLNSSYSILTKVLLEGLDPNRCPQQWITNYSLIEFINQNLGHENQRLVFTNFGSPINLTRTLDSKTPFSKRQNSENICPYKGLEYFDCNNEDPKYFYGREKLTDKLLDRVRQNNFLAILGASGSGKSSVLRAGLLHQLKLGRKLADSQNWKIHIMLPGEHPLQSLAHSWLNPNLSDVEQATESDRIKSLLKKGSEGLLTLVQASKANRVILVIDQFEEVFILCQDLAEREAFFQCLLEAVEQTDNKLCLILAMRIDFLGKCFEREYSGLADIIQDQDNFIAVSPMNPEELEQAIIKPAEKVNLNLDSGLAEAILRDIEGSPGNLPLLQDTLTELWKRRKVNQLKFTVYYQLGGIGGTLNQRATDFYKSLTLQEQNTAQHILLALTHLGEGTEDSRRRVLKQDLITAKHEEQLIDKVLQRLTDKKLIVTRDRVEQNLEIGKEAEVALTHEALIRNWTMLRQWLDESREQIRQKRKIEDAAQEWFASGQKTEYLLSKKKLRSAKDFQKEQQEKYPLSELAVSFIVRSSKYPKNGRLKSVGLFLLISLMGIAIGGYFVFREIPLNADQRLIRDCEGQKDCPGRIEALARLVEANRSLKSYNLENANLENANLGDAALESANLESVNLKGANLGNAILESANLGNAALESANLGNADLGDANLKRANLESADLGDANLKRADLESANLESADLKRANLVDAALKSANLVDANLGDADLKSANLGDAALESANLESANLESANLESANLIGTNLFLAALESANLKGSNLKGSNLKGSNLKGSNLESAVLSDADLESANLKGANLKGANLNSAKLFLINLGNANLRDTNLIDAKLFFANLKGANLNSAYLIEVKYLTPSQIKLACDWEKAFYKGHYDNKNNEWIIDEKANQQYIEQLKQDKDSDPQEPVDCSLWYKNS